MNAYEKIAVEFFVIDYDPDLTFREILNMLTIDNFTDLTIWIPFQKYPGEWIAEQILLKKSILTRAFEEKDND